MWHHDIRILILVIVYTYMHTYDHHTLNSDRETALSVDTRSRVPVGKSWHNTFTITSPRLRLHGKRKRCR